MHLMDTVYTNIGYTVKMLLKSIQINNFQCCQYVPGSILNFEFSLFLSYLPCLKVTDCQIWEKKAPNDQQWTSETLNYLQNDNIV